jgi:octaprenyl-diphosphate synthase
VLTPRSRLVNTVAEYIVGAGGKRMRPVLLPLLVARSLGYPGPDAGDGEHHF